MLIHWLNEKLSEEGPEPNLVQVIFMIAALAAVLFCTCY